jgi:serine/threonine protein kinase
MMGAAISHYKILEKLGEGTTGVIYNAHDTELDRDVAFNLTIQPPCFGYGGGRALLSRSMLSFSHQSSKYSNGLRDQYEHQISQ